ncbi:hypothetical protein T484DRAFT_2027897 [Baffinella frigidus]|nr:hypothetical protein T484DRAFT_2027897 [Cryptophyta sp. CCMP2293]
MDEKSFLKYYATQLQNKTEEPLPHVLKSQEYFRIEPSEIGYKTLDKVSFVNHNLDIITNQSDTYLYLTVGIKTKKTTGSAVINLDEDPNMVKPGGFVKANDIATNLVVNAIPERYSKTMSIPASAGFIFGYCYKINDTVIDVCNNDCSKGLCAVNSGVFAPQHKSEQHTGLSEPEKILMYQSHNKAGFMEFLVPLKYVVPFMEANQTLWGVKQSLDITKARIFDMFTYHNPTYAPGMTGSVTEFNISSMEWLLPYVKVENVTQSEIFDTCDVTTEAPLAGLGSSEHGDVIHQSAHARTKDALLLNRPHDVCDVRQGVADVLDCNGDLGRHLVRLRLREDAGQLLASLVHGVDLGRPPVVVRVEACVVDGTG